MMRTNGVREIDLDVEECPECKLFHRNFEYMGSKLERGQIVVTKSKIQPYSYSLGIGLYKTAMDLYQNYEIVDCKNCNATGYISVACCKLELE